VGEEGLTVRRAGGRGPEELRALTLTPRYLDYPEGSCLVTWGKTRVLCAASVLNQVPAFRLGSGGGWVTGEYSMLPGATQPRQPRELTRPRSRTQEIQRLIGRALRAVTDLTALGPRTVVLDCDVLQADGGTRTAAITGAFVALTLALERLRRREVLSRVPLADLVAAVSLGIVGGRLLLDLDYEEDSQAAVDANFVGTGRGRLIEVQATGEGGPFPPERLREMVELALKGINEICALQEAVLAPCLPLPW
jgi:ribonuclease PH